MKKIFQLLLISITFFILAGLYLSDFMIARNPHKIIDYYLQIILTFSFITFVFNFRKERFVNLNTIKFKLFILIFTSLFAGYFLFQQIGSQSLSRDELTQIELSKNFHSVEACALQAQPPLSCVMTRASHFIFGENETSSRLHIFLTSLLTGVIILVISLYLIEYAMPSALLIFFYFTHPGVIEFSYEVRPISLTLLWCSILLAQLSFLLFSKKKLLIFEKLQSVFIVFIFLNTAGLQPTIFIATLIISCLLFYYFNKNDKYKQISLILFLGFILFLPVQLSIFYQSEIATGPVYFFLKNIMKIFEFINLDFFILFIKLGGLFLVLPLLIILLLKATKKLTLEKIEPLLFIIFFNLAYYIFFRTFFILFIFFQLHDRYLLTLWPAAIFSLIFTFRMISQLDLSKIKKLCTFILFGFLSFLISKNINARSSLIARFNQKIAFDWINKNISESDQIIMKCLPATQGYCFSLNENLKSASFYLNKSIYKKYDFSKNSIFSFIDLFDSEIEFTRLLIIIERGDGESNNLNAINFNILPHLELIQIENETIFALSGSKKEILETWKNLITFYKTPLSSSNKILFEELLQFALIENDFDTYAELFIEYTSQISNFDTLELIKKLKPYEKRHFDNELF